MWFQWGKHFSVIAPQVNLVYSVPSGAIIKAKTHCDILLLSKVDIQQVLQHFPESKSAISFGMKF